ncbi:hypothetical protein SBRY_50410 [Actinacidiphila bryophytorum]|uniref:Uncharacterized protein n=1 Tax=Actinacidiphila bryophytorum TaxID=1436133 RepID=A0A9W4MET1_9ACTN|nr:hypothetical protein SBRY_50410 [Actinacidiphila bryophytorum]
MDGGCGRRSRRCRSADDRPDDRRPRLRLPRHPHPAHRRLGAPRAPRRPLPGRLHRLGHPRHPGHRRPAGLARRHTGAGRPHLPARRQLGRHRGAAGPAGAVGAVAQGRPEPAVRAQRADAGPQRGPPRRQPGPLPHPAGRRRRLRPALHPPRRAPGGAGPARHRGRARLGDERHHVLAPLRPRPAELEGVLEPHRRRHAGGPRPEVPLRLRPQPRHRRHPVDRVLPRRRHRRRHRHGLLRPAAGRVLHRAGHRAVRAPGAGRLRGGARQGGLLPRVGPVQERRRPRLRRTHAALDERPQRALPDRHRLLPARRVAVRAEPAVLAGLPRDALRPQHQAGAAAGADGVGDTRSHGHTLAFRDAYRGADAQHVAHPRRHALRDAEPGLREADDRTHRRTDDTGAVECARDAAGGRAGAAALTRRRGVPAAPADRRDEEAVRERRGVLPPHPEAAAVGVRVGLGPEEDRLTRAAGACLTPAAPAGR